MEADVRNAYYTLLRRLVSGLRENPRTALPSQSVPYYDYIVACVLHLLDIGWQLYDLPLLNELKIPDLLLNLTVDFQQPSEVKPALRECEDFTAEEYAKHQEWIAAFKAGQTPSASSAAEQKAIKQCKARFSEALQAGYKCDGCGCSTPGVRYRCLDCEDVDICSKCFDNGVIPSKGHSGNHDVVFQSWV
jgi:hypothetical protein